jgi:hypothetical protein
MKYPLLTWTLLLTACGGSVAPGASDAGGGPEAAAPDAAPTSTTITRREAGERLTSLCSEGLCSAPVSPEDEAVCVAEVAKAYDSDAPFPCDRETLVSCLESYTAYKRASCEGPSLQGPSACDKCK